MKEKIIVIKFGGSILENDDNKLLFFRNIKTCIKNGYMPVIVHGGGKEITKWLDKFGMQPKFVKGLRYTDEESIDIVEMVLSGKVNKHLVEELNRLLIPSIGISSRDGYIIRARRKKEFGLVGTVNKVNVKVLNKLIETKLVLVISPVSTDGRGQALNVNADEAAYAIASALKAERLIFMTDTRGILKDINDEKTSYNELSIDEAKRLINDGIIQGGMIPKVEACVRSLNRGVKEIDIVDGRIKNILTFTLNNKRGVGTRIKK